MRVSALVRRNIHLQFYTAANCGGSSAMEIKLTNDNICWEHWQAFRSFRIVQPSGSQTTQPSGPQLPSIPIALGSRQPEPSDQGADLIAWQDGVNVCSENNPIITGGNEWCGPSFCVSGICGFTAEGCGTSHVWTQLITESSTRTVS